MVAARGTERESVSDGSSTVLEVLRRRAAATTTSRQSWG